jgi:aerobic carbon-monoxide dehydrogenase medium subunit
MLGIAVTCDAEINVIGRAGMRVIKAPDFFVKAADFFVGALTTALSPDEIITEMRFPGWRPSRRFGFQEFARRRGDFAMSGAALYHDPDGNGTAANAHVGVIGVADRPLGLGAVEAVLNGRIVDDPTIAAAAKAASSAVNPPDDIHASTGYRRSLTGTMARARPPECNKID